MASYAGYSTAEEFDEGYGNFITPEVVAHWESFFRGESERVLAQVPGRHALHYGPSERNAIDFFPAAGAPSAAPTLVAIHGGLWFLFDKWFLHFLADAFTRNGVNVACINYRLAPGRGLGAIVEDCRQAVAYLYRLGPSLGIDRARLSVLGHSAAGQLGALVAATPWSGYLPGTTDPILHRSIGVSGFYDIEPFAQTHFHEFTQFPAEEYREWNPLRHVASDFPPSLLITGSLESSLLQQMMRRFGDTLSAATVPVEMISAQGEDHFSVLRQIGNPQSTLFARVLDAVKAE